MTFRAGSFLSFGALILSLVFSSVVVAQKPEPQKVSGDIEWLYDYEEAKLESLKSDKPMFVVIRCER